MRLERERGTQKQIMGFCRRAPERGEQKKRRKKKKTEKSVSLIDHERGGKTGRRGKAVGRLPQALSKRNASGGQRDGRKRGKKKKQQPKIAVIAAIEK